MHDIQPLKPFALFALNKNTSVEEHALLNELFPGRWKEFEGKYKGKMERSYLVVINTPRDIPKIMFTAKRHAQEVFMTCNESRICTMHPLNGSPEYMAGKLVEVTKQQADESDFYTYDPETKRYFICS